MDQNTVAAEGAQFDPARERAALVNALAEAARAALDFDFMSAAVLGAIPGSEPQQYVIAGTPAGISKMLMAVAAPSLVSEAQAERVPGGTAEQQARYAIDGAIQYGRENRNAPPSTDHWLYEYWSIGQQLRELGKTGWDNITPVAPPTAKEAEQASAQAAPDALCAAEKWANAEHLHARNIGSGGPGFLKDSIKAEEKARKAIEALADRQVGAQAAAAEVRDAADALNTILWLYRRLPRGYGRLPFVDATVYALARKTGTEVGDCLDERNQPGAVGTGEQA